MSMVLVLVRPFRREVGLWPRRSGQSIFLSGGLPEVSTAILSDVIALNACHEKIQSSLVVVFVRLRRTAGSGCFAMKVSLACGFFVCMRVDFKLLDMWLNNFNASFFKLLWLWLLRNPVPPLSVPPLSPAPPCSPPKSAAARYPSLTCFSSSWR